MASYHPQGDGQAERSVETFFEDDALFIGRKVC